MKQDSPVKLIVITDWSVPDCLQRVAAAAAVDERVAVQHRHHDVPPERFADEARRLREVVPRLFINAGEALARELGCGLHLPEQLPLPDEFPGPLSCAWHGRAPPAAAQRPDVITLLSPVFPPSSKALPGPALGTGRFLSLAATLPGPVFALGGLTAERLATFKPDGAAVIGAVLHAADPAHATQALLRALE